MVEGRLRAAAANQETFYGLLAAEVLVEQPSTQRENVRPDRSAWRALEAQPNVRAAMALAEIDEDVYAGEALRHQARVGNPRQHEQLIGMAEALSLPETPLWLAHNTPPRLNPAPAPPHPPPQWPPARGWQ